MLRMTGCGEVVTKKCNLLLLFKLFQSRFTLCYFERPKPLCVLFPLFDVTQYLFYNGNGLFVVYTLLYSLDASSFA